MSEVIAGRYELGDEIGRGGMARVLAARDLRLHRQVAVKLLTLVAGPTPDLATRQRFVREARAAAAFTHPNAVAIFDAGDADGSLYLVMELVDGTSLATVLARRGRLAVDEAGRLGDQVLQALGAAHRVGIVHRDVKPGNVLVTSDGVAKLADFGIAKRMDDLDLTLTGQFVGTPAYLSPEQVAGAPVTAATDLYSTGVLLFEALTGAPPFAAATPLATALAHRDAPVPDVREMRPDVPDHVAAALRRAMAKDPAARFASAEEMRAALGGHAATTRLGAPPIVAQPVAPTVLVSSRRRSRPSTAWWWLAVGVAVAVAVAVIALDRNDDPSADPPANGAAVTTLASTAAATGPATVATVEAVPPTVAPTTNLPPPPPPTSPTTAEDLLILVDTDPNLFGRRADDLRRELERVVAGNGPGADKLRERVADWSADGSISPDAAGLVDAVLAPLVDQSDDDRDDDDD